MNRTKPQRDDTSFICIVAGALAGIFAALLLR